MSRPRGPYCLVDDCGRPGTDALPIADDVDLDLLVCGHHRGEIAREPARWRLTSVPIAGTKKERTVVERVDPSPGDIGDEAT